MSEKKLGRGIASLLAMDDVVDDKTLSTSYRSYTNNSDIIDDENIILTLNINDVEPNPKQPRKMFDDVKLKELSESIKSNGLLQPIIVMKKNNNDGKYIIIAGERRFRASKLAGMETIKAIVVNIEEKDILKNALIENIQRENLNPVEEANGYRRIIEDFGYTHEQLAKEVGKSRVHITNLLRVLNLPSEILTALKNDNITLGHAKVLLGTQNPLQYLEDIIEKQLSVRQLEKLIATGSINDKTDGDNNDDKVNDAESITFDIIKQMYSPLIKERNSQNTNDVDEDEDGDENIETSSIITKDNADDLTDEEKKSISDNLQAIEEHIKQKSGLSVNLRLNRDGSGMVEIEYNDAEELIAIVNRLQ